MEQYRATPIDLERTVLCVGGNGIDAEEHQEIRK